MPCAYPTPQLIKAEIARRVALGEAVTAIAAEPGMPCEATVQAWRRAEPAFAAELAQARRKGTWLRRQAFDEAKAAAFLARVRAGERIWDVLGQPGMPSQGTYTHWRRSDAGFQAALWALKGVREQERDLRLRGGRRAFDQAVADRILVRVSKGEKLRQMLCADPSLPCLDVVYRWRRERRDWDGALKTAFKWGQYARGERLRTPDMTEAILSRIVQGESLRSLAREPGLPAAQTMYGWVARREAFARAVAQACDWREDWYLDQMQLIVDEAGPIGGDALRRRLSPLAVRRGQLQHRPGRRWRGADDG